MSSKQTRTFNLPHLYARAIDELIARCMFTSRSEVVRFAVHDLVKYKYSVSEAEFIKTICDIDDDPLTILESLTTVELSRGYVTDKVYDKMIITSIYLPSIYITEIDKMIKHIFASRSDAVRIAVRRFIDAELSLILTINVDDARRQSKKKTDVHIPTNGTSKNGNIDMRMFRGGWPTTNDSE